MLLFAKTDDGKQRQAMEKPPPPPEAVLIRAAREALHLRVADTAPAAGISATRWTQVESGSETRNGTFRRVRGKASTIAHMARQVSITPGRLKEEGQRPDAAKVLEEILRLEEAWELETPAAKLPFVQPATERVRDLATFERDVALEILTAGEEESGAALPGDAIFADPLEAQMWDEDADRAPARRVLSIARKRLAVWRAKNPAEADREAM